MAEAVAAARIFVAGHGGLVGSALLRALAPRGAQVLTRTRAQLDLRRQDQVEAFFATARPTQVIVAAAKVGGIHANNVYRAEFLYDNLLMAANVIDAAYRHGVEKLLFLGSSCIYPRDCPQPMREDYLLTGPLEQTNEPYAIAKIAGLKLVESYNRQYGTQYLSVMPTNLYGPGDNFDLQTSHVLPAMLRKFHDAKLAGNTPVTLWGSGTVRREFLHVDDLAAACLFALDHLKAGQVPMDLYNIGSGQEVTITELAVLIQRVVGHHGAVEWDASKPDGTPRKLQDTSRLDALGWRAGTKLEDGIRSTYAWFLANGGNLRCVG